MDDELLNRFGGDRIASRQIDELVGLARGVAADGDINQACPPSAPMRQIEGSV